MARWLPSVVIVVAPIVLGALYVSGAIHHVGRLVFPLDDPYIHLQYARNLATGHGFSFNPDEPSPGATSPAWVLLLALGRLVAGSSEATALVLGIAAAALAGILTYGLARALRLSQVLAALAGILVAATGRVTWASVSGMEAALAVAAATLVLRLYYSELTGARRGIALGAAAGLGSTVRPELLLLAALVGAAEAFRALQDLRVERRLARTHRRRARGATQRPASLAVLPLYAAVVLTAVLPYTLFCLHTAGRPFPNTFYAKSLIPLVTAIAGIGHLRAHYLPDLVGWLWHDNPLGLLLLVPGVAWAWRERRLVLLLWPIAFWVYALALMPVHFHHSRYTIPLVSSLALLSVGGIDLIGRRTRRLAPAAAAMLLAAAVPGQIHYYDAYRANVDTTAYTQVAMGEWIARNLPPGATVATHDVGAITYYGGHPCIDTIGLVSSDLITMIRQTDVKRIGPLVTLWAYLRERHPDYYVFFPQTYPELAQAPYLQPVHRIEHTNTTGGWDVFVAYRVVQ